MTEQERIEAIKELFTLDEVTSISSALDFWIVNLDAPEQVDTDLQKAFQEAWLEMPDEIDDSYIASES